MDAASVREAIDRLSESISADPAKARAKNAPATARLLNGLQCELQGPYNERLVTDMPPALGGGASGPNPGWIALSSLEVTAETDSDLRGILGLDESISAGHQAVRLRVKIASSSAPPQALRELVEWAEAHSPVGCTVKGAPKSSLEIEVL